MNWVENMSGVNVQDGPYIQTLNAIESKPIKLFQGATADDTIHSETCCCHKSETQHSAHAPHESPPLLT